MAIISKFEIIETRYIKTISFDIRVVDHGKKGSCLDLVDLA